MAFVDVDYMLLFPVFDLFAGRILEVILSCTLRNRFRGTIILFCQSDILSKSQHGTYAQPSITQHCPFVFSALTVTRRLSHCPSFSHIIFDIILTRRGVDVVRRFTC